MDWFSIQDIVFPVREGTLSRSSDNTGDTSWCLEMYCDESPQLDFSNWTDDRAEQEFDWIAGTEPYFYAQMLPLPVNGPEELIGKTFTFPQTPHDDPAEWDRGKGWLFFCLYLWEHELVYPVTISFPERDANRYHAVITGRYPCDGKRYELKADVWLEWRE